MVGIGRLAAASTPFKMNAFIFIPQRILAIPPQCARRRIYWT